ncbi:MAG: alkaline phosphatase family protein [Planctomycetaceae bacterium]
MPPCRQVVILGFDGLEPSLVESLLAAGQLPHFAELRSRGGMARVATTTPAQTPVAWSTFATGVNPGRHGIFDFLRRNPGTYLPELGLTRYEQKNAFVPPKAVNQRRGRTVWEHLSDADIPSVVIRCPCMYPPAPIKGRVLCGMGVPDLRGGLGTPTFFTTDDTTQPLESENVVRLRPTGTDSFVGLLPGPHNPRKGGSFECELTFHVKRTEQEVTVHSSGTPAQLSSPLGGWSNWLHLSFKTGLMQTVRGMVRLHVRRLTPHVEIYASPVNFDSAAPTFPISAPATYATEIEAQLGTYYTTGMVEDHTGLGNGRIDEHTFLAQCDDVYREREAMLLWELERQTSGCLFCLFDTPDRVQHMFWKHHAAADGEYRDVVAAQYRRCDATIGKVLERVGPDTLVIALSDHGFGSFHRGVNLNSWLHGQGLLAYKPGTGDEPGREFFHDVDWSKTQAYAVGLGGIYLNRAGRERNGIVSDTDAAPLARQIANRIAGLVDGARQSVAVRRARVRDDVYTGDMAGEAPDVLVDFSAGYRASWRTALGGAAADVMEDNTRAWAGDHIVDPELVPGVLLMNQPFCGDGARLLDMAPTVVNALGLPPQPAFEGASLLP